MSTAKRSGSRIGFVTVFGRDAEIIAQYARKGSALAFNGRLQTDSYTDREGQQHTTTSIVADSFEFVAMQKRTVTPTEVEREEATETKPVKGRKKAGKAKADDDDVPFWSRSYHRSDGDVIENLPMKLSQF